MAFEVCRMSLPQDQSTMDDFIFRIFLPDMPLMHIFNIDTNPDLPHRLPSPHQPSASPHSQDIYLKAVDPSGDIVAIAVNKEDVVFATDSNTPKEWMQMVEFFEFVEEQSHINELPDKTMELFALSVRQDWRQRGVAQRLAEESERLARAAGFTTMKIICANEFTARLARSLGWREYYRIAYKDYPHLALAPIPPHDNFYIYVKDL